MRDPRSGFGFVAASVALCAGLSVLLPAASAGELGGAGGGAGPEIVLRRYREILLMARPPEAAEVRKLTAALSADGTWPDINYRDSTTSAWALGRHLQRTAVLARALVHPESELKGQAAVDGAAQQALQHWLDRRYQNGNWWHNRIGTPRLMRDVLVLLEGRLSPGRRAAGWAVVAQSGGVDMTGANLIWVADLAVARGAAAGDAALLARAAARAAAEIKITTGEGIQPDYSFHQHGARLQAFHYGGSYAHDLCRLAWVLRGTPWAFPEAKTAILADYLLEGLDWMRRGAHTVPGTLDRAASRVGALGGRSLTGHLRLMREVLPSRAERFDAVIEREAGRGQPLVGFRHFPRSDFTAYHRRDFSVFLKTISRRTLPAEQINTENLKGRRLHCGEAYFLRDGQEYFNLMPVWDWFWLPGITIAAKLPDFDRRQFVGGVGDGQSGLAAMDYGFGSVLNARKAWFFHGDRVVFLTGDLRAGGHPDVVCTALDQCRLRGAVTLGIGGRSTVADRSGKFEGVSWLHHHGVAYVLFRPGAIDLRAGEAAGSWREINRGLSPEPVTDRVFRPLLDHGVKPAGLDCAYLLAPAAAPADAQALAAAPGVEVLSNGRAVQAVRFADGTLMAAFFDAGEVKDGTGRLLAASSPCLVMVRGDAAWISNPAHQARQVSVEVRGRRRVEARLPADGTAVKRDLPAAGL